MRTQRRSPRAGREFSISLLAASERVLAAVGIACVAFYVVACTSSSWFQREQADAFDAALRARLHAEQHDTSDWSPARVQQYREAATVPVQAIARLEVPTAAVSVMVLDGTDELTLNRAVGHIEGTARPGEAGNIGIAGHRDGFFRGLQHVALGDPVVLTTLEGTSHYEVSGVRVVEPTAVEVLEPSGHDTVTLVTCFPFYFVGDAPQRYIVHARRVAAGSRASLLPQP